MNLRSFLLHRALTWTDSGRGTSNSSRPNSQIDVSDNQRVSRNESAGKKAVQSNLSKQGEKAENGAKNISSKLKEANYYIMYVVRSAKINIFFHS